MPSRKGKWIRIGSKVIPKIFPISGQPPHTRRRLPAENEPVLEAVMGDILMMTWTGGRERTEANYGDLLTRSGFRLERVMPLTADRFLLEASLTAA